MNEALMNGPQLKSALWDAANTLRGSAVDRTDWKGYILPLLFFKRISDVWDEETAEAQEIYGEADPSLFPEIHRFVVPEGCHWNDVRETPVEEDIDRGKAALTELFEEAKNGETPIMVKRVVDDIDEIVRAVRFDGWQATHAGEREVKKALRQTLFKYKLHQDAELFDRAYGYIREYY